ncbi:MAG: bifunctional diguanylate cyclase/phosphodiesterase [Armatimonadota bacterium]
MSSETVETCEGSSVGSAILALLPDVVFQTDTTGHWTFLNQAWTAQLGYPVKESLGTSSLTYLHPDDHEKCFALFVPLMRREVASCHCEMRYLTREGKTRWMETRASLVLNADGGVDGVAGTLRDVTARKEYEDADHQCEAHFRELINNLPQTVFEIDLHGRFTFANESGLNAYGYTLEDIERGMTVMDVLHPSCRERAQQNIRRFLADGEMLGEEYLAMRKDGSTFPVLVSPSHLIQDGQLVGMRGVLFDLTHYRQTEQALRHNEHFLTNVFTSIQDGISILDSEMRVVRVNSTMERWYTPRMPVVGKKCYEAYHGRKSPCRGCPTLKTLATGSTARQIVPLRDAENKTRGWFDVYTFPLLDYQTGQVTGVIEYVRDITKRRQAEGALHESEQKLRGLVDQSSDGIILTDEEGRLVEYNAAREEMTGLKREDVLGKYLWDVQYSLLPEKMRTPDQLDTRINDITEFLRTGRVDPAWQTVDYDIQRPDGEIRSLQVVHFPVETTHGYMLGSIARDVTERNRAVEALQLNESRQEALLKLIQTTDVSIDEIPDFTLEEAIRLTGSTIGYLAFLNEDETEMTMYAWSKQAQADCRMAEMPLVYRVKDTGLWGEAIRRRQPMVTNDYTAPDQAKRGYPDGHVAIQRHLNVPIFDGERIVLLAGVGNKATDYDDTDVRQLTLLMSGMWRILQRARMEEALRNSELAERQHQQRLKALHEIRNELITAETMDELCRQAVEQGCAALGFERLSIWLAGNEPGGFHGTYGIDELGGLRDERGASAFAHTDPLLQVLATTDLHVAFDMDAPLLNHLSQEVGRGSRLMAPIRDGNDWIGIISADNALRHEPISEPQRELLSLYATTLGHRFTRIRSEQALRQSEHKYRLLADHVSDFIWTVDLQGYLTYCSPSVTRLTGFTVEEIMHLSIEEKLSAASIELLRNMLAEELSKELFGNADQGRARTLELEIYCKDGSTVWTESTVSFFRDAEGAAVGIVGVTRDIRDRKETELRLNYLAYYDSLTGLPNRLLLNDHLARVLSRAARQHSMVAVTMLDLDRFKDVNDALGHNTGDLLLQEVAQRLYGCIRQSDMVARMSGDEFVLVLSDIESMQGVEQTVQRVQQVFAPPFVVDGQELYISSSIGIAVMPADGTTGDELVKHADIAMYRAKSQGRNTFRFFSHEMGIEISQRRTLEGHLRKAIERQELQVYYQPQVDLPTRRVIGVEALVRWSHPELGMIPPNEFIPLAEETGLIEALDQFVLRTACTQASAWLHAGYNGLRMAVNVSAHQFQHGDLVAYLRAVLKETGLPPALLELEITENAAMQDWERTLVILDELRKIGVRIAIDDFGTGHCSFGYLKRFPIDTLKIDRSFIHDVLEGDDNASIVKGMIAMAHALGKTVIAEAVEVVEQATLLRSHGCEQVQGFLFSRPLTPEDCTRLLLEGRILPPPR